MNEEPGGKQGKAGTALRVERLDPAIVAILRTKTSAERLEMAYAMHSFARERLSAHLQFTHVGWSEEQVAAEVARRMLWNSAT